MENNKKPVYHGYTPKQYSPLVHWVIRFYFSHEKCNKFHSPLAEKQFNVVKNVIENLNAGQVYILRAIVGGVPEKIDLLDSYIEERIKARGMSDYDSDRFYRLLHWVDREVAIGCEFITRDVNIYESKGEKENVEEH